MKAGTRGEASIEVEASPATLYDVVSDVRRMGEWSPECKHCEWVGGATGPAVGAHFKGSNQRGIARWSTKPRVVVADPGREFAFVASHLGKDMTKWSYRFEPIGERTKVTESFEIMNDVPWYFLAADRYLMRIDDRREDLVKGMEETLQRLKTATERTT